MDCSGKRVARNTSCLHRFCLTGRPDFFKTRRRYADLNQAEDLSPLGSSPFPDPRNFAIESSGDGEEEP